MMYRIELSKQVQKFLNKQNKKIVQKLAIALKILANNPFTNRLDIKKLEGRSNYWRLRIGKYRFIYTIKKEQLIILVIKADTRGQIYKK